VFEVEPNERLKVIFLSIAFFLIIAGYTIAKDLKDSVFVTIVGKDYIGWAKIAVMFVLVPGIFLYSKLVDKLRRYQVLCLYTAAFGLIGLVATYFLGHPTIGLPNTVASPGRLFGWFFYFFVESYTPFVISVFWAFANSITGPEAAKKNYSIVVAASKLGGALSAGLAWKLFAWHAFTTNSFVSQEGLHQIVLAISSLCIVLVPLIIVLLVKKVPGKYLHGYEAVYQLEKKKKTEDEGVGIFDGLKMFGKFPYVFGIFGMVFFFEVVAAVLSILRLTVAKDAAGGNLSLMTSYLFETYFYTHVVGVVIALFGTRALLEFFGERICLLLIPLLSGSALLSYFLCGATPAALQNAFVALRAINYAFSWPVRESLYIPTVKEIKFKSKSWIDAFGSKFAKGGGSLFNILVTHLRASLFLPAHAFFFALAVGLWSLTAFFLGRRFDQAIFNNEVIGSEPDDF
jgi:AAA family ATP:ADP antiporter